MVFLAIKPAFTKISRTIRALIFISNSSSSIFLWSDELALLLVIQLCFSFLIPLSVRSFFRPLPGAQSMLPFCFRLANWSYHRGLIAAYLACNGFCRPPFFMKSPNNSLLTCREHLSSYHKKTANCPNFLGLLIFQYSHQRE